MKLLLLSMPSIHVVRWIENLKDTTIDLYWFDILNRGELATEVNLVQITNWHKRKRSPIKGEYWLSKKLPSLHQKIQPFLEVTVEEKFREILQSIQPDVVHSFEMHSSTIPILKVMNDFPSIKWVYSCWGSDLFYYQNFPQKNTQIKATLQRINYMHTDCQRDYEIAKQLGFTGKHLGIIPGGTGYKLAELEAYKKPHNSRNIILVKGYQHHVGRGINIIKALHQINAKVEQNNLKVVVFGAHQPVIDYINQNQLKYEYFDRHGLSHQELLQLMGESLICIGNSTSDGMPNTLLEAIVMGAFPIQSNPGNVTSEIIQNAINGLLIENPDSVEEIASHVFSAINSKEMLENAVVVNQQIAINRLEYALNKQKVIDLYLQIEKELCE
ncbi:MAG: glycosyltransferase [Flavobacteriales bacterium]|nr:glycosyltransferase [Flavobacteriales bacterium]